MPELDGVRGIAVLLVMTYHFWQLAGKPSLSLGAGGPDLTFLPAGGFAGVNLFFVLSGFMLFSPWARAWVEQRPLPSARRYYERRIRRIIPGYYMNLLLILLLIGPATMYVSKIPVGWDFLAHLLFVHNLSPATHQGINGVAWTLGVEVQFYLLLPLVAPLALRLGPLGTALAGTLIAVGWRLVSLALAGSGAPGQLWMLAEQTPGVLDQFASGMGAAMIWADVERRRAWPSWLAGLLVPVGAGAVLAALGRAYSCGCLYHNGATDLWWWPSVIGLGFSAIVLGSPVAYRPVRSLLAVRSLRLLGIAGYGVFLWHYQVADLLIRAGLLGRVAGAGERLLALMALAGPLALLIGTISWLGVERPCLAISFSLRRGNPITSAITRRG